MGDGKERILVLLTWWKINQRIHIRNMWSQVSSTITRTLLDLFIRFQWRYYVPYFCRTGCLWLQMGLKCKECFTVWDGQRQKCGIEFSTLRLEWLLGEGLPQPCNYIKKILLNSRMQCIFLGPQLDLDDSSRWSYGLLYHQGLETYYSSGDGLLIWCKSSGGSTKVPEQPY